MSMAGIFPFLYFCFSLFWNSFFFLFLREILCATPIVNRYSVIRPQEYNSTLKRFKGKRGLFNELCIKNTCFWESAIVFLLEDECIMKF